MQMHWVTDAFENYKAKGTPDVFYWCIKSKISARFTLRLATSNTFVILYFAMDHNVKF